MSGNGASGHLGGTKTGLRALWLVPEAVEVLVALHPMKGATDGSAQANDQGRLVPLLDAEASVPIPGDR